MSKDKFKNLHEGIESGKRRVRTSQAIQGDKVIFNTKVTVSV